MNLSLCMVWTIQVWREYSRPARYVGAVGFERNPYQSRDKVMRDPPRRHIPRRGSYATLNIPHAHLLV